MARRVAHILAEGTSHDLKPANILSFTFTEKAAAELKTRIQERCSERLGHTMGFAEMSLDEKEALWTQAKKAQADSIA